mmetsp:Transcript_11403/g.17199  ORF Transcript_11403/g.17199 Transcript_11403/m.17199 type:complete len:82 (+) Transcript_11403:112-357(+)
MAVVPTDDSILLLQSSIFIDVTIAIHSVLFATRAGKADDLFPSDDSDYEYSCPSDGAAATEDKQRKNKDRNQRHHLLHSNR